MMVAGAIFAPFLGMMLLTFVVWVALYVRRLRFIAMNRIDAQEFTTPEKSVELSPEEVRWPANNFKNLLELPVLFYALCLYLYATDNVDFVYVASAWVFLGFRIIHSVVHCTVNIVKLRFASYMLASIALWFMVIRAAMTQLS